MDYKAQRNPWLPQSRAATGDCLSWPVGARLHLFLSPGAPPLQSLESALDHLLQFVLIEQAQ